MNLFRYLSLLPIVLIACNQRQPEKAATPSPLPPRQTTVSCHLDELFHDSGITQLAKDIYQKSNWPMDESILVDLLDSLYAKRKELRPFYFKVVTMTYPKADGAYAEILGAAGKDFVKTNTAEFAHYISDQSCFTPDDIKAWANIVMLEFEIEDGDDLTHFNSFIHDLETTSHSLRTEQRSALNGFIKELKRLYQQIPPQ